MKISYKWLRQYIDTGVAVEEISKTLTTIGLEVESIEKIESVRGGLNGVIIGRVLTCEKHPDADKLSVTTVDLGEGDPRQIVCGAPNVAAGQTVMVATPGCTLYPQGMDGGLKIKKSKIRGVESEGMICAEDELGLGSSHEGIIVIPDPIRPGTPAREYLKIEDDYVFEIGLTPNRIDAASHYGVARDLAAYYKVHGTPVKLSRQAVNDFAPDNRSRGIAVEVENAEACPRYMGITVSGITIAPSPEWLQERLRSIGINPKNNVVDITNYVLHSTGQPLHAFDADRIEGGKIVVRTCPEGTPFVTLDGVERKLSATDLMICSAARPMCIAGIFGGLDSGVSEDTKNVFIESAYFNPVWVRKSARYHGLNTDSSFRFERGCDPDGAPYSLMLAAMLVKSLAGGEITSDIVDVYPERIEPFGVEIRYANINKLIGKEIPAETVKSILSALEIEIKSETPDGLSLAIPLYRVDVRREADVVEEILRIYGYNNIEIPQHVNSTLTYAKHPDKEKIVNSAADFLSSNGFNEIMSNSLTKASYYENNEAYPIENCVKMLNPLSNDLNVMRRTLLYNALEAAQLNVNHRNSDLKLYEFGNCYHYNPEKAAEGGLAPYSEEFHLSLLVSGAARQGSWNVKQIPSDLFTLKAVIEKILRRFGLDIYETKSENFSSAIYREGMRYTLRGKKLFEMGVLTRSLAAKFDVKNDVFYCEINFDELLKLVKNNRIAVRELARFPEVRRDLALLVDKNVSFGELRSIALGAERKLLKSVTLFDVYEGDKLPEGKKSYALGFVFQDPEATMTDMITEKIMSRLVAQFEKLAGAQVRN